MTLRFHVADSLTGKLSGRLPASTWDWTDPLTGSAQGTVTVPLPRIPDNVRELAVMTAPHRRQVVVFDELGPWFGGPILADPEREGDTIKVPFGDWRAWFYAASIRPNADESRQDFIVKDYEQTTAMADLARIALDTVGAPRLSVVEPAASEVLRKMTFRMFANVGKALDNIAERERGPDWWTPIVKDPADETKILPQFRVGYPERSLSNLPVQMRYILGQPGSDITGITWPRGTVPPSRVFGVGSTPAPAEEWAVAEHPTLLDGDALAWDEVWQLPDGADPENAYEHALSRLQAHGQELGVIELDLDADRVAPRQWETGDRARLLIEDGWREVDLPEARILSRTLTGRGAAVTGVKVQVNLSESERDIDEPVEEVEGEA